MKCAFFFFLLNLTLTSLVSAAADWKVVAETVKCHEKFQVLAKVGEKFVYVSGGQKIIKLSSVDGDTYKDEQSKTIVFQNLKDKNRQFSFILPSVVEGNPAKLDVALSRIKDNCDMTLKC